MVESTVFGKLNFNSGLDGIHFSCFGVFSKITFRIQAAGIAPEVIIRITSEKAHKKGSTLALKPRTELTRSPKQGYQWPHKKDFFPLKLKKGLLSIVM